MHEVTVPQEPELDVLWQKRPAPLRKPKRKDYRLLRARITNLILLGIICVMAVVIYILKAGSI